MKSVLNHEGTVLQAIKLPNVIFCKSNGEGVFKDDYYGDSIFYGIVMEYDFKENLYSILYKESKGKITITRAIKLNLFKEILKTVIMLQKLGILHCDLKAENIVVSPDLKTIKLIDFGCAICCGCVSPIIKGKLVFQTSYRAPELMQDYLRHTEKSEVFALGCILFQLLFLSNPFLKAEPTDIKYCLIANGKFPEYCKIMQIPNELREPLMEDLLWRMFSPDPESRPTFVEVLQHKFLN